MAQILIPGYGYIDEPITPGQYLIPGYGYVDITNRAPSRRALVLVNGTTREIRDSEIGKGMKPLVLLDGVVRQRQASEGVPLVLYPSGTRKTLGQDETLII